MVDRNDFTSWAETLSSVGERFPSFTGQRQQGGGGRSTINGAAYSIT